jgi:geranylgeranyl diphosphate synthase type II
MPSSLQQEMARIKSEVDELILKELLPFSSPIPEIDLLYRMMRDYPARPAKGLRPLFCVASCRAMGGQEADALLTAACIELFQHWILIHDDVEDRSELRRGQPALHLKYGESLAINAGDALHAEMWKSLLRNEKVLGVQRTLRILQEFSTMVDRTTEGQHMELSWVRDQRWDVTESDYYEMVGRKTSWYTVASPCRLGAIIANAEEDDLERILQFGQKLGEGFQIQDDVLNLTGDSAAYGKVSSDDLLEGKRTLMLLRLLKVAGAQERVELVAIMNKRREEKTEQDLRFVLSLMKSHGTIEYAERKAKELVDEALAVMKTIRWRGDSSSRELLESAARFAVERKW